MQNMLLNGVKPLISVSLCKYDGENVKKDMLSNEKADLNRYFFS